MHVLCYCSRGQKALRVYPIPQAQTLRPYCTTGNGVRSRVSKHWFEDQLPLTSSATLDKFLSLSLAVSLAIKCRYRIVVTRFGGD